MKNAYIIHGCNLQRDEFFEAEASPSNLHWIPWLQRQLVMESYNCQTPEMPKPYAPSYDEWLRVFESFPVDEKTVLVGHSCGAGFLLKWLNKTGACIDKLVLVAPWLDPDRYLNHFLQCRLKPDLMAQLQELHVLYSKDEPVGGVTQTVDLLRDSYPGARLHKFDDLGHFTRHSMDTDQFPELLKIILG